MERRLPPKAPPRPIKSFADPTNPLLWFAKLEDALRAGNCRKEAEARRQLAGLGITRVDFDVSVLDRVEEGRGAS